MNNLNSTVLHPVARVSLKFTKVQIPPYETSVKKQGLKLCTVEFEL
jgi:hypothetical protein